MRVSTPKWKESLNCIYLQCCDMVRIHLDHSAVLKLFDSISEHNYHINSVYGSFCFTLWNTGSSFERAPSLCAKWRVKWLQSDIDIHLSQSLMMAHMINSPYEHVFPIYNMTQPHTIVLQVSFNKSIVIFNMFMLYVLPRVHTCLQTACNCYDTVYNPRPIRCIV